MKIGSAIRGAAAAAVGTLAMDGWLYRDYRRGGGETAFPAWESSEGVTSWDDAPAPALVAKKLLEGLGAAVVEIGAGIAEAPQWRRPPLAARGGPWGRGLLDGLRAALSDGDPGAQRLVVALGA